MLRFNKKDCPAQLCRYLHLLRLIIDIYQQQIVQDQILDKTVLVHSFPVCRDQILKLAGPKASRRGNISLVPAKRQHIFRRLLTADKKQPCAVLDILFRLLGIFNEF